MKYLLFIVAILIGILSCFSSPEVFAQANFEDSSITIDPRAKLPKHLTDDDDTYPVRLSMEQLHQKVINGRPAMVVFWGTMRGMSLQMMGYLEANRKQLEQFLDLYFVYIGRVGDFDKEFAKLVAYVKSETGTEPSKSPVYIAEHTEADQLNSGLVSLFDIRKSKLPLVWPTAILVDGGTKRMWPVDIGGTEFEANLGWFLKIAEGKDRASWVKTGKYQPIQSPLLLDTLLNMSFLDAEDLMRLRGFKYNGWYNKHPKTFRSGAVQYFALDCGCLSDSPDMLLGVKDEKVVYAAFTSKAKDLEANAAVLEASGYTKVIINEKNKDQFYWRHPKKATLFFADRHQMLGIFDNPLLIEALLPGVEHRWDDFLKK